MKKSVIILLLAMFLISAGAAYAQSVTATQKGPATAQKGENITISYTIANNGNQAIYNVTVSDQEVYKFLGTINPGQKKTFTQKVYIPTDKEVKEDFGPDATVSNPFFMGGFAVTYQDANGNSYAINSNSLSIPLISNKTSVKPIAANITDLTTATDNQSIIQQIINLINSIIQSIQNLFTPNANQ